VEDSGRAAMADLRRLARSKGLGAPKAMSLLVIAD
jgi:hypothetical protein